MKTLVIDSSSTTIHFLAKNEDKQALLSLDIGMHQSESLIPCIQNVLDYVQMQPKEIEFTALCAGPGSFTSLRLAYAALKALELAYKIPIYGISTLQALAHPFIDFPGTIIPVVDAKKNRFYLSVYRNSKESITDLDIEAEEFLQKYIDSEETIFAVGPDADLFKETVKSIRPLQKVYTTEPISINAVYQLAQIAYEKFIAKENGIAELDGPLYIRPSEAEEALIKH